MKLTGLLKNILMNWCEILQTGVFKWQQSALEAASLEQAQVLYFEFDRVQLFWLLSRPVSHPSPS